MKSDERLKQTPSCSTTRAMQGLNDPLVSLKMTAPHKFCSHPQTHKFPLFLGMNLTPVLWKMLHQNGGGKA